MVMYIQKDSGRLYLVSDNDTVIGEIQKLAVDNSGLKFDLVHSVTVNIERVYMQDEEIEAQLKRTYWEIQDEKRNPGDLPEPLS